MDCAGCPAIVVLPPGDLLMGTSVGAPGHTVEEEPAHSVRIGYPLAVGKHETTFEEWDACVADGVCKHAPRDPGWGRGKHPVINVSWNDVTGEYLPWLSRKTGQPYRLLTEAEWEYAARVGGSAPFSTGATITTRYVNFDGTATYAGSDSGEYRNGRWTWDRSRPTLSASTTCTRCLGVGGGLLCQLLRQCSLGRLCRSRGARLSARHAGRIMDRQSASVASGRSGPRPREHTILPGSSCGA